MQTVERWQQIKDVLDQALQRAGQERDAYLQEACAGDDALRAEVLSLLQYENPVGDFSLPLLTTSAPQQQPPENSLIVQQHIGHYQLLGVLGRGGMGTVYLATRTDDFRQQVALKLLNRGLDSAQVLARFRNERQILAALTHPHIARLLDGGTTTEGAPFLVMEYIAGEPLDVYCRKRHLSTAERLHLFCMICDAVQYAHQHLVIHRDLKPSNILVASDGVPKLLDFGIAKLLTPELAAQTLDETAPALRLMTPAYASPEQVKGDPITTASDVYSLGVVLYELLTGHSPYRTESRSPSELLRVVCEQEPEKPSTAATRVAPPHTSSRSTLARDLDAIILKALRKEPLHRYGSIELLRADIQRYLHGQPVLAHKGTIAYRTGKFLRRHKVSVAATVLLLGAIATGVTTTIVQRNRAEQRFNDVRKLANAVIFDYQSALETLPGATNIRARMIRDSLAYLDSLASEAGADPTLQSELGKAYEKIGDIQGNTNNSNLNDSAAMMRSYQRSLALREAALKSDPTDRSRQNELALAYEKMGDALVATNDLKGALALYEKAQAIVVELAKTDIERRRYLATLHQLIGDVLGFPGNPNLGNTRGAREHYQQGYEISRELFADNPTEYKNRQSFVLLSRSYANILNVTGDASQALEILRQAEQAAETWVKDQPLDTRASDCLALTYDKLSDILEDTNELPAALRYRHKHLALAEQLAAADAHDARAQRSLTLAYLDLGDLLAVLKDQAGAEQAYLRGLHNSEQMLSANPGNAELRTQLADGYSQFGYSLANANKTSEALRYIEKSLALYEELAAADPNNLRVRLTIAEDQIAIGELSAQKNRWEDALRAYQKALPVLTEFVQREPENTVYPRGVADLHERLGAAERKQNRWRAACEHYRQALAGWQSLKQRNALRSKDEIHLATLSKQLKQCEGLFVQ